MFLRRLTTLAATVAVALSGVVIAATPAAAKETITVNPNPYVSAADPLEVTIDGFPEMVDDSYYVYWLIFSGMTGSNSGTTCPTFSLVGGAGTPTPNGSPGKNSSNPTYPACEWTTGNTFRFVYSDATGLNNSSQVKITFPANTVSPPSTGRYGVDFKAGRNKEWSLDSVCMRDCTLPNPEAPKPEIDTLDFDGNGGTCTPDKKEGVRGTWSKALTAENCSKPGMELQGFSPNASGDPIIVGPGGPIYFNGSNRLYAVWGKPKTVADAPTDVVAVAGLNKVTLTWKAPANDGGYRVTNYLGQADPSGRACITTPSDANPLSCTIALPATNTKYTFTAQALNGMGWSNRSAASNAVSPYGFGQIRASRENVLLGLAGTKVQAGGSAPGLSGLAVTPEFKIGGAAQWSREPNAAKANADGEFSWSKKFPASANKQNISVRFTYGGDAVSETLVVARGAKAGSLSAPRNVKVENELNRVNVKWDAPEFDGGAKITGYKICWTSRGTTCTKVLGSTEKTLYNMRAGRETVITVAALTASGKEGPAAKAPKPITPVEMEVAFSSRQARELIATVRYAGFKPGSKIQVEMNSRLPGEEFPAGGFRKVSTITVDASGAGDQQLPIPLQEGTEFTLFRVRAVTPLGNVYSGLIPPFRY